MRTKYNYVWPDSATDLDIEFSCYKIGLLGKDKRVVAWHHLRNAALILYPADLLVWHKWCDLLAQVWCDNKFATVWGPAAAGKTHMFALFALLDWWSDPLRTRTVLCSTTSSMLKQRVWGSVVEWFSHYSGKMPGRLVSSRLMIIDQTEEGVDEPKAGIFGIAVLQGSESDAKSNIIGVHRPFMRLVIDEMQATRRAAVEARANMSKGCIELRVFGLGNPMSRLDVLGEFSEPVEGWDSVNPETGLWRTKYGRTYHLDGRDSPAIDDPEGLPFLINAEQIEKDKAEYGDDGPEFWTMCIGFCPPEGLKLTVLSEAAVSRYRMDEEPNWRGGFVTVGGCDPAFTSGGNRCILRFADIGYLVTGELAIALRAPIRLEIKLSGGLPVLESLGAEIKQHLDMMGVDVEDFAIDDTGTQSLADEVDRITRGSCHRVRFGNKASDLPVSQYNDTPCSAEYANKVTELWYTFAKFARYGQIKGFTDMATKKEFCLREVLPVTPKRLMSKKDMRSYRGVSPDNADAAVTIIDLIRNKMGVNPGSTEFNPDGELGNVEETDEAYQEIDIDSDEGNYTEDGCSDFELDDSNMV